MNKLLLKFLVFFSTILFLIVLIEILIRLSGYKTTTTMFKPHSNPLISYTTLPNLKIKAGEIDVNTNSYGLRDYEYPIDKPSDVYRILVLGDSIIFASEVNFEDTTVKILEKMLNDPNSGHPERSEGSHKKYEVINFSVRGYSTVQEVNFFETYVLEFKPDRVIICYCLNDPEPVGTVIGKKFSFLRNLKNAIRERMYFIDWMLQRYYAYKIRKYQKKELISKGEYDYLRSLHKENSEGWKETVDALKKLVNICENNKIEVLLIIPPSLDRGILGKEYPYKSIHLLVLKTCKQIGLDAVNISSYFEKYTAQELQSSPNDYHFNAKGQKILAEAVFTELKKRNIK